MPDSPPTPAPTHILRRAGNLLTSTGHVQPIVKQYIDPPTKSPNKLKLTTSIKLKLKEVKDGALSRSKSLSIRNSAAEADSHNGDGAIPKRKPQHTRSASVSGVNTHNHHEHIPPRMSLDSNMRTKDRLATVPESQPPPVTDLPDAEKAPTPESATAGVGDVTVPQLLQQGTPMTKVSAKDRKRAVFRLDPDIGQIIWESKKHRISMSTFPP